MIICLKILLVKRRRNKPRIGLRRNKNRSS